MTPSQSTADPNTATTRAGLLATIVGLLAACGCLSILRDKTIFPTSYFRTDSGVSSAAFDLQLVVLVLGIALLNVCPPRFAKPIAIAQGAGCLAVHGRVGALYLVLLVVWFGVLEIPFPKRIRLIVFVFALLTMGVVGSRVDLEASYLFSLLFSIRLIMYAWDKWQRGWPRGRLADFSLYFLSAPLIVFPPYIVIIPFFERHSASFKPRLSSVRARLGLGFIGTGILAQLLLLALRERGIGPALVPTHIATTMDALQWLGDRWIAWGLFILAIGRVAYIAHGLLLLCGFVDRPPMRAPFLATDYVEMWNRFQTHQKDMQVALFYSPVLIRLRRSKRWFAITAAVATTMFAGNLAVHILSRYVFALSSLPARLGALYIFFFASFVVLSVTLCLHDMRQRKRKKARQSLNKHVLYVLACWFATQTFTAVLLSF